MSWKKRARPWLIGLVSLYLVSCLSGCGTSIPRTVTKTKIKPLLPPEKWLQPISHPKWTGTKNRDLLILLEKQKATLDLYQIRLRKLRQWRKEHQDE